jgi:chemotaxis protein histidine kinase CheA
VDEGEEGDAAAEEDGAEEEDDAEEEEEEEEQEEDAEEEGESAEGESDAEEAEEDGEEADEEEVDEEVEDEEEEEEEEVEVVVKKQSKKAPKKVKEPAPKPKAAQSYAPVKKAPKVSPLQRDASGKMTPLAPTSAAGTPLGSSSMSPSRSGMSPHALAALPLPKRRRSIPKNFSSHSLLDLANPIGSRSPSADPAGSQGSPTRPGFPALAPINTAVPPAERIAQLESEFSSGMHRVPDPPSIKDEDDLRDRAHVRAVPVIPIEVKRRPEEPKNKKKFVPPVEEVTFNSLYFDVFARDVSDLFCA